MNFYIQTVTTYPIISAMIQFAILGTLGDIVSKWIIKNKVFMPYSFVILVLKMIEWAILALFIKYAFIGYHGFIDGLVEHDFLPKLGKFAYSFAISASMNLQFGLLLVILHRLLDNIIDRQNNWENIHKGMLSLLWFWVPAHTVTFMLDKPYQIGLAALWSVVLGVILGFYNKGVKN